MSQVHHKTAKPVRKSPSPANCASSKSTPAIHPDATVHMDSQARGADPADGGHPLDIMPEITGIKRSRLDLWFHSEHDDLGLEGDHQCQIFLLASAFIPMGQRWTTYFPVCTSYANHDADNWQKRIMKKKKKAQTQALIFFIA